MELLLKLVKIQSELNAPKGQYNSFGNYKYRSCEDIVDAVKPILKESNCVLLLSDEVVLVGDRYYVKATATLLDAETGQTHSSSALAREEETKKGMDASQITGSASSYARKYALNGLFAIDDEKDADTKDNSDKQSKPNQKQSTEQQPQSDKITTDQLIQKAKSKGVSEEGIINSYKAQSGKTVTEVKFIPADVKKAMYHKLEELPDKL